MKGSHFSKDIQEFLNLLFEFEVRYVIVGGEAVIYHGYARLTGDVDIFYEPSIENAKNLFKALKEFWKGNIPGIESDKDLLKEGVIIQFGVPPNRIDLMNSIDGVSFEEAWKGKVEEEIKISGHKYSVYFIGLKELIKNKEAMNRYKDLEDLKYLRARKSKLKILK